MENLLLSPLEDMLVVEMAIEMLDEAVSFDADCYDIILGID